MRWSAFPVTGTGGSSRGCWGGLIGEVGKSSTFTVRVPVEYQVLT